MRRPTKKKTLYFFEDQWPRLEALAAQQDTDVSKLIRRAVDAYLDSFLPAVSTNENISIVETLVAEQKVAV